MSETGVSRPRYQGLAAARRWRHDPVRPTDDFSLAVGDRVGDLTVIGHLARGRMTELYQVWSNEHWCALTGKLVAPEFIAQNGASLSFRREQEALKRLTHPNIVRLFGSGNVEGRPYLLLEYLAGPSLFDVLETLPKRRLHVPDAIRATMHIGAAVHYLHRQGFLYRDLKPANVLLREGIPILVDFDVVRRIGRSRPADRLGTAPYMAPEQVLREPLSPATDVYGLGALLYELLTGHWPMEEPQDGDEEWDDEWWEDDDDDDDDGEGKRPDPKPSPRNEKSPAVARVSSGGKESLNTADLHVRYPQLRQPPVPPREHRPNLDPALERILLRCLEPASGERFQTVSGMLAALAPLLKGQHRLWPEGAPIERRSDTISR